MLDFQVWRYVNKVMHESKANRIGEPIYGNSDAARYVNVPIFYFRLHIPGPNDLEYHAFK